jgi:hypothetical protein
MTHKYANEFYVDNNDVVRWKSNDSVPPSDILTEFLLADLICQEQVLRSMSARKIEDEEFLIQYIANRQKYGYSAEERAEMQNAFGGETVVDVFTGQVVNY